MEKPVRNEAEAAKSSQRKSEWRSKDEEYKMISDLTGFDNLRAMMEGEATVNRKKRRRKRRMKKKKSMCLHVPAQQPILVDAGKPAIDGEWAGRDEAVRTVGVSKLDLIQISDDGVPQKITADTDKNLIETAQAVKSRIEGTGDGAGSREVIDLCSSSSEDDVLISNISFRKRTREMVSMEATRNEDGETVDSKKTKMHAENAKCAVTVKSPETEPTANTVLQKLLRKPRYFDFPSESWDSCLWCGEDHPAAAASSTLEKRKPCFLCGSLQHIGKHCIQGEYCFVCRGSGHQAKSCQEKQQNTLTNVICLRCGDSGHEMFSCTSDYSPDDLKKIQCYICNDFGHLSCTSLPDTSPTEISCYNCGQCGHLGSECTNLPKVARGSNGSRLCFRCREEGHFARNCTLSRKHARRIQAKMRRSLVSSSVPPILEEPQNDAQGGNTRKTNHQN